jgi:uncharacterized membrane protein
MEILSHLKYGQNVSHLERMASLMAGTMLTVQGLRRRSPGGILAAAAGAELIRRGASGHCYCYELFGVSTAPQSPGTSVPYPLGVRVDSSVTINRPVEQVYQYWRNLENLPNFMRHLKSVTVIDETRSRWEALAPRGKTVEWEAEIISDIENERIAWRSLPGSKVQNAGSVHFRPAPGNRGTVVTVELQYNPPAGIVGAVVAWMSGEEPSLQIKDDIHRLKQALEAGEVPTIEGQSAGDRQPVRA